LNNLKNTSQAMAIETAAEYLMIACSLATDDSGLRIICRIDPEEAYLTIKDKVDEIKYRSRK